jgi:hypothetical protein
MLTCLCVADGFRGARCTGIIIAKWEEPDADSHQSFLVVTSSKIVCMDQKVLDPIPKVQIEFVLLHFIKQSKCFSLGILFWKLQ